MRKRTPKLFKKLKSRLIFNWWLVIAITVLLIGSLVKVIGLWEARIWKGNERITVVVASSPVKIFSYQEGVGLAVIELPHNLEIDASNNAGRWKVESLYELGKIQGVGGKLLSTTLQSAFGIPIGGYLAPRAEVLDNKNLLSLLFATGGETNLAFFDRVQLSLVLSGTPDPMRRTIYPEKTGMLTRMGDKFVLNDGSLPRELVDVEVSKEGIGIGVINTSRSSGLGRRAARVIEGLGAPVLWVKSDPTDGGEDTGRCKIRAGKESRSSLTVRRLFEIFSCTSEIDSRLTSSAEFLVGGELATEFP